MNSKFSNMFCTGKSLFLRDPSNLKKQPEKVYHVDNYNLFLMEDVSLDGKYKAIKILSDQFRQEQELENRGPEHEIKYWVRIVGYQRVKGNYAFLCRLGLF